MGGLDDLLKGAQGASGGGGLGDLLGGILGGGSRGGSLAGGGLGGNPMLRMLLPMVASMLANGGLEKVLSGLQAKGKTAETDSWVSTGENQPVAGEDIRVAVGDDEITSIADKLGVSKDEAATAVATVLPDVVDQVSPNGELPPDDELESAFDRLKKADG
ncbi:MAG: YidB family protein [Gaiellaceae bacterium MAG52_C11]|nr:YidB family protein [Candidatus Gaiellasilicea maunaloa]